MEVGKDTADMTELGTRENMMVARSSLANSQHRSESASLGDAGDPFGTIIRRTRDMKPQPGVEGQAGGRANTRWLKTGPKRPLK